MRDLPFASQRGFLSRESKYYVRQDLYRLKYDDYVQLLRTPEFDTKYNVAHKDPWTYCNVIGRQEPVQGWKIHISGTYINHFEILTRVFKYAVEKEISFKFVINTRFFCKINGRESSRPQHGKSIVIYPDQERVKETLEELYVLLKGYEGPYILTDRPYKDSKVIYYRYGEILPVSFVDEYGTIMTKIYNQNFGFAVDKRNPYFELPERVEDLFTYEKKNEESVFLSKYDVKGVLHFSSQGGVYEIIDKTGRKLIAKEARGFAAVDAKGRYGTDRLEKEYVILKQIGGIIAPKAIELIKDNGNSYLIEDFVPGKSLIKYPYENSPLIVGFDTIDKYRKEYEIIVYETLKALSIIEQKGIVIGDVSCSNIMYDRESETVKFIDFEIATHAYDFYEEQVLITPGYEALDPVDGLHSDLQKVCIALLNCIYPYTQMYYKFPNKVFECIDSLMTEDVVDSGYLLLYREVLKGNIIRANEAIMYLNRFIGSKEAARISAVKPYELYNGLLKSIKDNYMAYNNRKINNIPCDAAGYNTNTFCLGYGSAGVMYSLSCIGESEVINSCKYVTEDLIKSVYMGKVHTQGLYVGKAGVAVALRKAGVMGHAESIVKGINVRMMTMADISYGIAGIMATDVEFYRATEDEDYKEQYYECVRRLRRLDNNGEYKWKDAVGDYYHGLTRGGAGIALVLLQGAILFNDLEIKKYAIKVLDRELENLDYKVDGSIKGFSSMPESAGMKIYSPYVHSGLCGLGIVLIRFYLVTKDERYMQIIDKIRDSLKKRRPLFAGWLRGITGIVGFINDYIYYLNRSGSTEIRNYFLELMCLYCVGENRDMLLGDELYAASNDLFTGSAGALIELNRSLFCLDNNKFIIGDEVFENYRRLEPDRREV